MAIQSWKLETTEQERPVIGPQSTAKGLGVPWRIAHVSSHSEAEGPETLYFQAMTAAKGKLAKEEWSLDTWEFPFFCLQFNLCFSLLDGATHIRGWSSSQFAYPHANHFWKVTDTLRNVRCQLPRAVIQSS